MAAEMSPEILELANPRDVSWLLGSKLHTVLIWQKLTLRHVVGYHLLWSTAANIVGTDEQKERIQKLIIENNYFVGGREIHILCSQFL